MDNSVFGPATFDIQYKNDIDEIISMGDKQKFIILAVVSLGVLAAILYFGVRPLIHSATSRKDSVRDSSETPKSIQEQIREELIAPPKTQTPDPMQILKELSASPAPTIATSPGSARPSLTPSPQQVLDSLLEPG